MSHRPAQVAAELLKALSQVIQEELPVEKYGLVTITDVIVTSGLEQATVYVSALQEGRDAAQRLRKKTDYMKHLIKKKVNLRKIPRLNFEYDASPERVERFEELENDGNVEST